ncbi:MAG TPA: response regulator, partial [Polyangiales bacterium]
RDARLARIPVVAMSGDLSPQAAAIDAAAYLPKPLDHTALVLTVRNIATDLQRRRDVARASELQRLVSLGALVGGIAHEINNPLAFVTGNVDILQRQLFGMGGSALVEPHARANALHALNRVRTGIDRIAHVVGSVSMFAFADSGRVEPTDVHEVLESSLQIVSNELRHCARVERCYEAVPHVRANPASLGQVFLNLLLNAVFAIREHEQIGHVIRVESATRGEHVVITFTDSATTLRPGAEVQVFDPLASEDGTGRMGLRFGLAVTHELVEAMGGTIELEALEPAGVAFRVVLPCCDRISRPPPPLPAYSKRADHLGKRPRILVVDDDPLVCELFEEMLYEDFEVTALTVPLQALAALRGGQFDLILCDVMMPDLDGLALYERATLARPELRERFVFVTGGAFSARARGALRKTQRPVLQKPCYRHELLDTIHATLKVAAPAFGS